MPIFMPEKCMRGYKTCEPLALIDSDSGDSYFCCGENDGTERKVEQDKYTLCFKNSKIDEEGHWDKRDLVHQMAVVAQALAIIEEEDSEEYHKNEQT